MRTFQCSISFVLATLLLSCIDRLDLPPDPNQENSIAITGRLIKGDPSVVDIFLSDIFTFDPIGTVLADEVKILNELDDFITLKRIETSRYHAEISTNHPFFKVDFGSKYAIEVSMLDKRIFRSEYEELFPLPTDVEVAFELNRDELINNMGELEETTFIDFIVSANLAQNDSTSLRTKFNASRTYRLRDDNDSICYVFDRLNILDAYVVDANTLSDPIFSDVVFSQAVNYNFAFDYYFGLVIESIGPGPLNYFEEVSQLVNPAEQVFQLPNGQVRTNIYNVADTSDMVHGYFYPTALDTIYLYIDSIDVGEPAEICPLPSIADLNPPSICDSCPFHFSIVRPEYYNIP